MTADAEIEKIAHVFREKRFRDVNQPKLGTGRRSGTEYIDYRNRNDFQLGEADLRERREQFEAFFQPEGPFQIFVPTNTTFFERVMTGNPPPSAYKGVSYNPRLLEFGERFENIDFFAWAKGVQESLPDFRFLVYDAGMYQVINEVGPERVPKKYDARMAERMLELLQTELEQNTPVRENAELRNRYLNAILEAGGVTGEALDARKILTPDNPEFTATLQQALDYCRDQSLEVYAFNRFVRYRRYDGEFAKTYTPLVIAEAMWLYDVQGNDVKFGPTSEREFDKLIRTNMRQQRNVPYMTMWFARSASHPDYSKNLFFSDDPDAVRRKLKDSTYRSAIETIVRPFEPEGSVEEKVISFMKKVNARIS